jgi:hypothetical protein
VVDIVREGEEWAGRGNGCRLEFVLLSWLALHKTEIHLVLVEEMKLLGE